MSVWSSGSNTWVKVGHVDFQCVKSKSVTNLAEATADPSIDNFDARGNAIGGAGNKKIFG